MSSVSFPVVFVCWGWCFEDQCWGCVWVCVCVNGYYGQAGCQWQELCVCFLLLLLAIDSTGWQIILREKHCVSFLQCSFDTWRVNSVYILLWVALKEQMSSEHVQIIRNWASNQSSLFMTWCLWSQNIMLLAMVPSKMKFPTGRGMFAKSTVKRL